MYFNVCIQDRVIAVLALLWIFHYLDQLLTDFRCADWFLCMQQMLLLAPAIVESRLVGIINVVWTADTGMVSETAYKFFCVSATCMKLVSDEVVESGIWSSTRMR
jgi:hypothetical protein